MAHVELPVGELGMLDLQSMYSKLELNCMYQKTMFPGLIFRADASPVVLLCFSLSREPHFLSVVCGFRQGL